MDGVEKKFGEAYVEKRWSKAVREGEEKPFSGSALNNSHEQLCRRGDTDSDVLSPLPNQMLYSLEGYLD